MARQEQTAAPTRLGQLVDEVRARRFVGRKRELNAFQALLGDERPRVIWLHAPGGYGKTLLVQRLMQLAAATSRRTLSVDLHGLAALPEAVTSQLALSGDEQLSEQLFELGSIVLFLDGERLTPLAGWLQARFLPCLASNAIVVVASREAPPLVWRHDPSWGQIFESWPLPLFDDGESLEILAAHGLKGEPAANALRFANGHPLALSMVADQLRRSSSAVLGPRASGDLLLALARGFSQDTPERWQRDALRVLVAARATTESALDELLPEDHDVARAWNWLRELHFVTQRHDGLAPNELARAALAVELRSREPEAWRATLRALSRYHADTYERGETPSHTTAADMIGALYELLDDDLVRSLFDFRNAESLRVDPALATDAAEIVAMVEANEGADAAQIVRGWLCHPAALARVIRDLDERISGLYLALQLERLHEGPTPDDPALTVARGHLKRRGIAPTARVTFLRSWMARDTYQSISPVQVCCAALFSHDLALRSELAYSLATFSVPEHYAALAMTGGFTLVEDGAFVVGGRRQGMFARDWRAISPLQWTLHLIETGRASLPGDDAVSLSELDKAVGRALRDLHDRDRLAQSPLVDLPLVRAKGGDAPAALALVLREGIASLGSSPRGKRVHAALHATFVAAPRTQEEAAEALDLPFSTYRRHLRAGISRVTELIRQSSRAI